MLFVRCLQSCSRKKLFSKNSAFLYSWVSWHHSRGDMKQSKHGGKLWRRVPIASPRLPSILFSQVTLVIVWVIRGKLSKIQNNTYAVESFNTIHTYPVLFYITYDLSATHILFFLLELQDDSFLCNCSMCTSLGWNFRWHLYFFVPVTPPRVWTLLRLISATFSTFIIPKFLCLPPQCIPCTDGLFLVSKLPYIFHAKYIKHISQDVKLRPCYEKEHVAFVLGGPV